MTTGYIQGDAKERIVADKFTPADNIGRRQYYPLSNDWIEMNPEFFTYLSASTLTVVLPDDTLLQDRFQIGDKVRIKQVGDSNYRYFYVINRNSTTNILTLDAGDDYTISNLALLEFAIGRGSNPTGHPQVFVYEPDFTNEDGTPIPFNIPGAGAVEYSMNGVLVTAVVNFFNLNVANFTNTINISTPFTLVSEQTLYSQTYIDVNSAGSHVDSNASFNGVAAGKISIQLKDLTNFGAGNNNANFTTIFKL